MKKILILLAFLLLAFQVEGQVIRANPFARAVVTTSSYSAEYQAVYDEFTTNPTSSIATAQNTLVETLVADGVWAKLDCFYVFAVQDATSALLNWIDPTGDDNCTNVHSTAFVAYEGFTGDGTNDYLETNFNAGTEGTNYTLNAASIGVYLRIDQEAATYAISCLDLGDGEATFIIPSNEGNQSSQVNSNNNNGWGVTNSQGLHSAVRVDASHHHSYWQTTDLGSDNRASTGIPDNTFVILGYNAAGSSTNQVSVAYLGGLLTGTDITNLNNAIETYMDSNSKGVE